MRACSVKINVDFFLYDRRDTSDTTKYVIMESVRTVVATHTHTHTLISFIPSFPYHITSRYSIIKSNLVTRTIRHAHIQTNKHTHTFKQSLRAFPTRKETAHPHYTSPSIAHVRVRLCLSRGRSIERVSIRSRLSVRLFGSFDKYKALTECRRALLPLCLPLFPPPPLPHLW